MLDTRLGLRYSPRSASAAIIRQTTCYASSSTLAAASRASSRRPFIVGLLRVSLRIVRPCALSLARRSAFSEATSYSLVFWRSAIAVSMLSMASA